MQAPGSGQARWKWVAFWAACFTSLAVVRLCHLRVLWADEAYGLAAARRLLEGAALYREVWFDKPPLYAWINLLWGAHTGWPLRFGGALFTLLCCWLAARAAARLFGDREALFAAAAMAFFLSFDHPNAIISLAPDLLLIPFALGAVWAMAAARPLAGGACAAAGLLAHTKGILLLPLVLLWQPRRWKLTLAGYAAALGLVCLLVRGWLEPVWEWGVLYARDSFVSDPVTEGLHRSLNWAGFHAALLVGAGAFLLRRVEGRARLVLWLLLAGVMTAAGARFFPRYYLAMLPPLVLAAARGISLTQGLWLRIVMAAALMVPAVRFGARHVGTALQHPAAMRDLALFEDCREAAVKIRALAQPDDTLLVWGYRPELNVLAGLKGATPFLDSQPLTGVLADRHLRSARPTAAEVAQRNRARLASYDPTFIADGLGPLNPELAIQRFAELAPWLARYEPVARTRATWIYRRR